MYALYRLSELSAYSKCYNTLHLSVEAYNKEVLLSWIVQFMDALSFLVELLK